MNLFKIIAYLLLFMVSATTMVVAQTAPLSEYRPIGGSGNNLRNPGLNPVPGSPEVAVAPLNLAGGGPNARTVSNVISGGTGANGQNSQTQDPTASAWLYVFGQFVDHDLDLEDTPLDNPPFNISIPPGDPVFANGGVIQMNRATRDPSTNTIINTAAGYLDLSQLYGSDPFTAFALRNDDGTLKTSTNGTALPILSDTFITGDPRVMENPELTALTTLFMREHNFWVATLRNQHPDWTGDQLYNLAKAITTGEYQNIIYNEFLPLLIGPVLGPYPGYNFNVNAQVTQEFTTAAFRVGHSQVSGTQEGIDINGNVVFTQSLADAFFNTPEQDIANGIDPLLRNIGTDFSQATDPYAVPELRNLLFAGLVGGGIDIVDLIAIDIQREKDVGLGTLNQTRIALGMSPYLQFSDITPDFILQLQLQALYGTVDNIDLFIGGLCEQHASGAVVGPTFQRIIANQFQALRMGDRFFWRNQGFDTATAQIIASTTLATLVARHTNTPNLTGNLFLQADFPPVSTSALVLQATPTPQAGPTNGNWRRRHQPPSAPNSAITPNTHGTRRKPFPGN